MKRKKVNKQHMHAPPSELHCYRPRKLSSNCDKQLSLTLRNSIAMLQRCYICGGKGVIVLDMKARCRDHTR